MDELEIGTIRMIWLVLKFHARLSGGGADVIVSLPSRQEYREKVVGLIILL